MKRIVLWGLSTISALVLLLGYHTSTSSVLASSSTGSTFSGSLQGSGTSGSGSAGQGRSGGTPPPGSGSGSGSDASSGSGSSGGSASTVTGAAAHTAYGPVQVQLDVQGSTITNVTVLQYPTGNGTDVEINSYALPQLIQETLDAQSADIHMVSGATYTSGGYLQSLQSALDQVSAS